ncbi:hypothetical protein ON010_g16638 [Phytophthora cinnamomi]|nr:hypothetical protein ON010_g16638 [Phytophthora cinnamomi]
MRVPDPLVRPEAGQIKPGRLQYEAASFSRSRRQAPDQPHQPPKDHVSFTRSGRPFSVATSLLSSLPCSPLRKFRTEVSHAIAQQSPPNPLPSPTLPVPRILLQTSPCTLFLSAVFALSSHRELVSATKPRLLSHPYCFTCLLYATPARHPSTDLLQARFFNVLACYLAAAAATARSRPSPVSSPALHLVLGQVAAVRHYWQGLPLPFGADQTHSPTRSIGFGENQLEKQNDVQQLRHEHYQGQPILEKGTVCDPTASRTLAFDYPRLGGDVIATKYDEVSALPTVYTIWQRQTSESCN